MKHLKRMLVIAVMLSVPSTGAFAQDQKRGDPKPKAPDIVVKPKPPPPENRNNDQKKGGDSQKKP